MGEPARARRREAFEGRRASRAHRLGHRAERMRQAIDPDGNRARRIAVAGRERVSDGVGRARRAAPARSVPDVFHRLALRCANDWTSRLFKESTASMQSFPVPAVSASRTRRSPRAASRSAGR